MLVLTDAELVEAAQSGDEKAFEALVEKHRARIDATISSFVSNAQDREDIAQDTFINAFRNLHQLSNPDRFSYWLVTIAQNLCRNWLNKHRSHTIPIDEVDENLLNSDNLPERESIEAEQRQIITQAIKALPETERQIASAHYLEGTSHKELANRHGLSYQAVCARLSRAKQKLAKRLGHLLTGVFISPITALKQIYSRDVMKVGTVPKITAGAVAIIVLAFIGTRQFLSSREDSSPSVEVVTSAESAHSVAQTDATRKGAVSAPVPEDKPQISAEEMQQIEDFFAQLDEADVQSGTNTSQLPSDSETEPSTTDTNSSSGSTGLSAEQVMHANVEGLRNLDFEAALLLATGDARRWVEGQLRSLNRKIPEEEHEFMLQNLLKELESDKEMPKVAIEMIVQEFRRKMQPSEQEKKNRANLERRFGQVEVVSNEYVGDEFHFRLRTSGPFVPEELPDDAKSFVPKYIDAFVKMQKADDVWQIYESADEVVYH